MNSATPTMHSKLLKSALQEESRFSSIAEILAWLEERRKNTHVEVQQTRFSALKHWQFEEGQARLCHSTGRFFSIDGINVKATRTTTLEWDQPIIVQPEIGYLGIIAKEFDGVYYFLMQAKVEPGNIKSVQISPTIQATKSNYTRAHVGSTPKFLEYFQTAGKYPFLADQLQSEQGSRFFRKRNRNVIIDVNEPIEFDENYRWMTLHQIKRLMRIDNTINMDTRSVISCIQFKDVAEFPASRLSGIGRELLLSSETSAGCRNDVDQVLHWLTQQKLACELKVEKTPLSRLKSWDISDTEIAHKEGKYFKVIPMQIMIEGREVTSWCQPLIKPEGSGMIGFVVKRFRGVLHALVQSKFECGNFDLLELAPTVQYGSRESSVPPVFADVFEGAPAASVLYDQMQSEEGGRFFREQNRNMIVEVDERFGEDIPENFCWVSLSQLQFFGKFNNYLNVQARSLLSALEFS